MTIGFDLGYDLDLEYGICCISAQNGLIAAKQKEAYQLNSMPQMWPSDFTLAMTLTLNFQGEIFDLLYLMTKWSDCHEKKNEHID